MGCDGHICWYTLLGSLYNDKCVLYRKYFDGYRNKEITIKIPIDVDFLIHKRLPKFWVNYILIWCAIKTCALQCFWLRLTHTFRTIFKCLWYAERQGLLFILQVPRSFTLISFIAKSHQKLKFFRFCVTSWLNDYV
jgi:hypothetical protein